MWLSDIESVGQRWLPQFCCGEIARLIDILAYNGFVFYGE